MIEILDKSDVKEHIDNIKNEKNDKIEKIKIENIKEKDEKKNKFNFIAKDRMKNCGRAKIGLTNNCALCQNNNKTIFEKCQNKWA